MIPKATKGHVFIEPVYDTFSAGGIVLCKQAQERALPNKGYIRSIGEPTEDFKVGDLVLHNRHTQEWEVIPWGEKKLSRVKIEDVEAVI